MPIGGLQRGTVVGGHVEGLVQKVTHRLVKEINTECGLQQYNYMVVMACPLQTSIYVYSYNIM